MTTSYVTIPQAPGSNLICFLNTKLPKRPQRPGPGLPTALWVHEPGWIYFPPPFLWCASNVLGWEPSTKTPLNHKSKSAWTKSAGVRNVKAVPGEWQRLASRIRALRRTAAVCIFNQKGFVKHFRLNRREVIFSWFVAYRILLTSGKYSKRLPGIS